MTRVGVASRGRTAALGTAVVIAVVGGAAALDDFTQPDDDSPYARGTPAPVVRYTGEDAHRVDLDVAWSPKNAETYVTWEMGGVSDNPTLTGGGMWRRNGTVRPGTTVWLAVRSRATLEDGGWVTGKIRVDGHPVGTDCEVVSYRSCTVTYVIPG